MGSNFGSSYNVDICMCMDATGSMGPLLDLVKANALGFYGDLTARMAQKDKHVDELRVRVIVFRDYLADGQDAMLLSDFFVLPQQAPQFEALVRSVHPRGGGDDPEDSLEALGYAIKSKWTKGGDKRRHVIVLWTDDEPHDLGFGRTAPNYPGKMARDFTELSEWWGADGTGGVMDPTSKRLLIYAPNKGYWNEIMGLWDNTLLFPSQAGKGLEETTYTAILDAIANSI